MKSRLLLSLMLIFSLSLIFAHGGDIVNQNNSYYPNISEISLDLKIVEINEQLPIALAIDEKGKYYVLKLDKMFMFYNDLPIEIGKEIKVEGVVIYSFSKIEELIIDSIEIDNKEYMTPKNFGYGMMNDYGYPGMMGGNMMNGYGYPGMMGGYNMMMNGYGYPGMMNGFGGYGYPNYPYNEPGSQNEMDNNMMGNN